MLNTKKGGDRAMRRTVVAGALMLLAGALLIQSASLTFGSALGEKKVTFKLMVPEEDAKVAIEGKDTDGEGYKRNVEYTVPEGKESVLITVLWEPNNYTKITRKKKVTIGKEATIAVDFTKADPKNPDDIVVRFVPTPDDVVEEMCVMAKVGKNDVVYDLGCGDGRMVITAVKKFGAKRGVGIDIDPKLVKECKANAKKAGVDDKVEFREGDVLKVKDLSDATVVLLYMGEDINKRLKPILLSTLKPGSRVVSHRFEMGDDWKPEQKKTIDSTVGYPCDVLLWTIKANKDQ
jgi:SAM-dependent methyltransferase